MRAVVIGIGQFGRSAARIFAQSGVETIAVDKELELIEQIKEDVDLAVATDATVYENLAAHGIEDADVLVAAIGEDFEAQILTVVNAKRLGIARVVARAASSVHQRVLLAIGADEVVNPEQEAAQNVVQRILTPSGTQALPIAAGLAVVRLPAAPGMAGRTVSSQGEDFLARSKVTLFAVQRRVEGSSESLVDRGTRIQEGDVLFLAGKEADLTALARESAPEE